MPIQNGKTSRLVPLFLLPTFVVLAWFMPFSSIYSRNIQNAFQIGFFLFEIGVLCTVGLLLAAALSLVTRSLNRGCVFSAGAAIIAHIGWHAVIWIGDRTSQDSESILFPLYIALLIFLVGTLGGCIAKCNPKQLSACRAVILIFILMSYVSDAKRLWHYSTLGRTRSGGTSQGSPTATRAGAPPKAVPDIYYIVPDGLGSASVLKEHYAYDLQPFEEALRQREFVVNTNAHANYATTFLSLASCLNMRYLNYLEADLGTRSDRSVPYQMIDENRSIELLRTLGYQYIHLSSGWGATVALPSADAVFPRGRKRPGLHLVRRSLPLGSWWVGRVPFRKTMSTWDFGPLNPQRVNYFFDALPTVIKTNDKPSLVLAHVVAPHPPFLFAGDGTLRGEESRCSFDVHMWFTEMEDGYAEQVTYVTSRLLAAIDQIRSTPRGRKAIIIIQADHGPSITPETDDAWIDARMKIFAASFYPAPFAAMQQTPSSPVNTFRYLFKTLFGYDYPALKDHSYYSSYRTPYCFREVATGETEQAGQEGP
jgi:hypothetical protein